MPQNRRYHMLPPSGVVSKYGVHDDREPTCEGDPRFSLVRPLGNRQRLVFQAE
jgi:hypothetical protein